jgi:mannose-6-phosphate isomerase-like protein (cupin superfamily)
MNPSVRRVVTGHNASGRSIITSDGPVEARAVAHDRYVWTTGSTPADNRGSGDAAVTDTHRLEPAQGGSVFRVVEFPPASALAGLTAEQKEGFFKQLFEGMQASHCRVDTARSPGMHRTSTVDYVIVLRGEVTLLLDDGETTLRPGDLVVQRGTNHDWEVRGNEPALIAVVMLGANPV